MNKLILGMVVIGVGVYMMFSYFFTDVQINKYSSIEAVYDEEAIKRGWIPKILPKSAYEIVETHDIDKNTVYGSFKYKEKDESEFLNYLSKMNDINNTLVWEKFLFRVDNESNSVKFRNKF